jgi:hypothetical protein
MARTLLGNKWMMCLREEYYCALLGNSAPMKTLARNHVTCFLRGLPYATIELGFLCGPCRAYIRSPEDCSGGLYKKSNPSLFIKGGTAKEIKKQKS